MTAITAPLPSQLGHPITVAIRSWLPQWTAQRVGKFAGKVLLVLTLLLGVALTPVAQAGGQPGWLNDAPGLEKAITLQTENKKPIFLYMYAPWCPYCKRYEKNILSDKHVATFLKDYITVQLYPQTPEDKQVMKKMKVTGFPETFVKYPGKPFVKVEPYTYIMGHWNMMTPQEFTKSLQKLSPVAK